MVTPVETRPPETAGSAGAAEAITLGGLEPGQTLQFIVRAIRSGIKKSNQGNRRTL